ncbi:MAG TPA: hypothetical protein VGK63_00200, partial [Candidatus Limnocylindrales bacterium]
TKSEIDALAASSGASAAPSATDFGALDPAAFKSTLEGSGLTLAYAGTAAHYGGDAYHLTVAIDMAKLQNSSVFDGLTRTQLGQMQDLAKATTIGGDVWVDKASGRLSEVDAHGSATGTDSGTFDFSLRFSDPAAGTTFDAPASSVEVPISSLMGSLFQLVGQNAFGPTP